jgi:hypothetical protein
VPGAGLVKVVVVDADKLSFPLGIEDHGDGHVSVVPRRADGSIDDEALDQWAASRGGGAPHPLTQKVLEAVVRVLERGEA